MKANEKSNSKLKEFKLLFVLSLAIALISLLSFLLLVNKDPSQSKGDSFLMGALFGAFLAFSILTGVIMPILSEKNKSEKEELTK